MRVRWSSGITGSMSAATHSQNVRGIAERGVERGRAARLLGQRPRLAGHDVLVQVAKSADQTSRSAPLKSNARPAAVAAAMTGVGPLPQRRVEVVERVRPPERRRRNSAESWWSTRLTTLPEVVGEIRVVPRQKHVVREAGVLTDHHFPHDEVPERVDAEPIHIALAAGPRCPATWTSWLRSSATSRDRPRAWAARDPAAIRKAGQYDRVLPDDLLAHEMHVCRPVPSQTWPRRPETRQR